MTRRTERVADLLRREISDILLRRLSDPRVRLASVSEVDVSPDLKHARVKVSFLGSDEARDECVAALEHAAGFIRSQLAGRLRTMRGLPRLLFEIDHGAEHSRRIEDLLEHLHDDEDSRLPS